MNGNITTDHFGKKKPAFSPFLLILVSLCIPSQAVGGLWDDIKDALDVQVGTSNKASTKCNVKPNRFSSPQ